MQRADGRSHDQLRPVVIQQDRYGYASSSVVLEVGNTKVLCAVTLQQGVPPFLRGKQMGWLVAEYALMPYATQERNQRATSSVNRNGRCVEISRLISRALRAVINLDAIPDQTLIIDCDVLQADGGTRTASISGSYFALLLAQEKWLATGVLKQSFLVDAVAAVSVGIMGDVCILDPSYEEDTKVDADLNFILTKSGMVIEVQGGVEKRAVSWALFDAARLVAMRGIEQWFAAFDQSKIEQSANALHTEEKKEKKLPLFSLHNRTSALRNTD